MTATLENELKQVGRRCLNGYKRLKEHTARDRPLNGVRERELHMNNCFECVLGQVFGNFWTAIILLWPKAPNHKSRFRLAVEHGFACPSYLENPCSTPGISDETRSYYAALKREWVALINNPPAEANDGETAGTP